MIILLSIGKTVLILFLVIICILAVVLLMPVRYELDADIDEKRVDIRVNWLFKLVRFRFHLKERMEAALFILFFKKDFTDPGARKKRAEKKVKRKARRQRKRQRQRRKSERRRKKLKREYEKRQGSERAPEKNTRSAEKSAGINSGTASSPGQDSRERSSGSGATDRGFAEKKQDSGVLLSVRKLIGAVGNVFRSAGDFRKILGLVRKYELISAVWPEFSHFLRRVRPGIVKGQIFFGLEDPAATGQITGVIAMIPLFYQTGLRISPDFETEETYVRGNVYIKGHMLLIHAVILIAGLVREKRIRLFIGAVRKRK